MARRLIVAISVGREIPIYERLLEQAKSRFAGFKETVEVMFFSIDPTGLDGQGDFVVRIQSNRGDSWEIPTSLEAYPVARNLEASGLAITGRWSGAENALMNVRDVFFFKFLLDLIEEDFILFRGTITSVYDFSAISKLSEFFTSTKFYGGRIQHINLGNKMTSIASGSGTWISKVLIEKVVCFAETSTFTSQVTLPNDVMLRVALLSEYIHSLTRHDVVSPALKSTADVIKAFTNIRATVEMNNYWHVRIKLGWRGDPKNLSVTDERYEVDLFNRVFRLLNERGRNISWCSSQIFAPK
jgi:hypothetical protein